MARAHGVTVIADEVYHLLDWSAERPARFAAFDPAFTGEPPPGDNPTGSGKRRKS